MQKNLVDRALHLAAVSRSEEGVHEDIVGLEHAICFEFPTPVSVGVLQSKQPAGRLLNTFRDVFQTDVDAAESWRCRPLPRLRIAGTFLTHQWQTLCTHSRG